MRNTKATGDISEACILAASVKLRIRPTKNNQRKGVLWAKTYKVVGPPGLEPGTNTL
jgi:hypothetical protein